LKLASLLLLGAASRLSPQATSDQRFSQLLHAIDSATADRAPRGQFSGVVTIARIGRDAPAGGLVVYERAVGVADRDRGAPISPATKFVTASVAQTFVAVAVAQLAERGAIALDATVSKYLPDSILPHARGDRITVRQLLTHCAGFATLVSNRAFRADPASFATLADLMALIRIDTTAADPGTFRYADADYTVLAELIERVSGAAFETYMRDQVFRRIGMLNTGFDLWPRPSSLARGYTSRNTNDPRYASATPQAPHANDSILPHVGVAGSVAYTTAADLVRFADALARRTLLSSDLLTALAATAVATGQSDANSRFGFGFFVGSIGQTTIVNHGGTGPGIDNGFDIYPELGLVVVVLTNLDPPAAQEIRRLSRNAIPAR
jgi:CubicO group peptidase (beta-lactamase class C family)